MLRRSRALWWSKRVWRPRLIFWAGAVAIGIVSVAFARMADLAQQQFHAMIGTGGASAYLPLIVTPAGFVLCAYLAMRFFPNAQGSGIPQAIAARHLKDDTDRVQLLSLRMVFGKILLTVVGLFCGASIGREGPTVQVGASLMLQAARWGGMAHARGLILAGSAAGVAAAFNTPLAGIVFAIEEMGKSYESRANGLVLTAVILSGLAAIGLVGNYTYFGESDVTSNGYSDAALIVACGVGGGILGALFSAGALKASRRIRRWASPRPMKRMLLLAGSCGLAVAIIGILSGGATFGTGYEQARSAVEGNALPPYYFIEKYAAGFLSMASGIPGGIFAPSLSVGASFGSAVGQLLGSNLALAALLGMAGYFAGVVQAPMTAFVIILEMTGSNNSVIALMCASMLGYGSARMISHEPLYHALSRVFVADAIRRKRAEASLEQAFQTEK
ncbi:chloride channel protein [Phyllobacterium sp. 0TCS1.6C]|uniref:chloride channel protein n=1 Tax=unclassified Phyllobacterium TaxID=2638441 RepID=UPI002265116C|nr:MULTISPECIES: chloride channel protein [unclassified Phyllobacterium]MCX8281145.1 chloride channel protein [Phyllobacterium sp. 0TCS1.6C]MCX8294568.1 chloride channel protein [Phyllobacterium sp. 0TCS1.6A]